MRSLPTCRLANDQPAPKSTAAPIPDRPAAHGLPICPHRPSSAGPTSPPVARSHGTARHFRAVPWRSRGHADPHLPQGPPAPTPSTPAPPPASPQLPPAGVQRRTDPGQRPGPALNDELQPWLQLPHSYGTAAPQLPGASLDAYDTQGVLKWQNGAGTHPHTPPEPQLRWHGEPPPH